MGEIIIDNLREIKKNEKKMKDLICKVKIIDYAILKNTFLCFDM